MKQNAGNLRARVLAELRAIRQRVATLEELLELEGRPSNHQPPTRQAPGRAATPSRRRPPQRPLGRTARCQPWCGAGGNPCEVCQPSRAVRS